MTDLKRRNPSSGLIETLLILPLLLLLFGFLIYFYMIYKQNTLTQTLTWNYGMHRKERKSTSESSDIIDPYLNKYTKQIKEQSNCASLPILNTWSGKMSNAFKVFLINNCPKTATLHTTSQRSNTAAKILNSISNAFDKNTSATASFKFPSSDFSNSTKLKDWLWRESMFNAGFGALPLQMLAVLELASVVGFVNVSDFSPNLSK